MDDKLRDAVARFLENIEKNATPVYQTLVAENYNRNLVNVCENAIFIVILCISLSLCLSKIKQAVKDPTKDVDDIRLIGNVFLIILIIAFIIGNSIGMSISISHLVSPNLSLIDSIIHK